MTNAKKQSEKLFEEFCVANNLTFRSVPPGANATPDYEITIKNGVVAVEIKQIESTIGFNLGGVYSRKVGSHVRRKIAEARNQLKAAADAGMPAILLIYNAIDPQQIFGTERQDFTTAMYGEWTVNVDVATGKLGRSFHGSNAKLRRDANTSFSGVGHLRKGGDVVSVTVYENVHAKYPLPFDDLPPCIKVLRAEKEYVET